MTDAPGILYVRRHGSYLDSPNSRWRPFILVLPNEVQVELWNDGTASLSAAEPEESMYIFERWIRVECDEAQDR